MTRLIATFAALLVAAAAVAQDKKAPQAAVHQISENDKVKVYEVTFKAGAENKSVASSSMRVVRAIRGGQLERTYTDGKTEILTWKPGQTRIVQPGPAYSTKNVGKSVIVLYVVQVK